MCGQLLVQMTMRRLVLLLLASAGTLAPVSLGAADHPQVVVIVRHAEKSAAPAGDVTLNEAGQARAEELAIALAEAKIDTIVVTQFRRTRDTAAPTSREVKVTPVVIEAGTDTARHVRSTARRTNRRTVAVR
jgi:phosphohistidine phosphatase SixA